MLGQRDLARLVEPKLHDQQAGAHVMTDHRSIGDRENRRRVDDDQVKPWLQAIEQRGESGMHQQFGRIGRYLAARNEEQLADPFDVAQDLREFGLAHDQLGQAMFGLAANGFMQRALAHVRIDQQHTLTGLGHHRG